MKPKLFIRNDDVGADYDPSLNNKACNYIPKSLGAMVDSCIKMKIPIMLGVIPDRLNAVTSKWLNDITKNHPDYIEIAQHGYTHKDHGCKEFGSCRSYDDQYHDIKKGLWLMREIIKKHPKVFIPPNNRYSKETLRALRELGFTIISGKYRRKGIHNIANTIGRILDRDTVLGIPASKHEKTRFGLIELSVSVDFVKSYNPILIKKEDEILDDIDYYSKYCKVLGLMTHHWTFSKRNLKIFQNILDTLKSSGFEFTKLQNLSRR